MSRPTALLIVASCIVIAAAMVFREAEKISADVVLVRVSPRPIETVAAASPEAPLPPKRFVPGPFTMDVIKKKGCVADGMLSGYAGNTNEMVKLIKRSECRYLHRSLETWLESPDFTKATDIMAEFEGQPMVFGMFIAEAVDRKSDLRDTIRDDDFDFSKMCRAGTENAWGEHTCKPSFENKEYRKYVQFITQRAMDIGIQSFLFGQIHYQDWQNLPDSELPGVVKAMRRYAKEKGLQIIIGAQTNAITDKDYLKLFDYIEGGVGMTSDGDIESGPCWSAKKSCWALLWHDRYRKNANHVILNLDWGGLSYDDMSKFARMDQETRLHTLKKLHAKFTSQDIGFLLPFLAPLYPENTGCYGPKKRYYSPDNRYACKDEAGINAILKGN